MKQARSGSGGFRRRFGTMAAAVLVSAALALVGVRSRASESVAPAADLAAALDERPAAMPLGPAVGPAVAQRGGDPTKQARFAPADLDAALDAPFHDPVAEPDAPAAMLADGGVVRIAQQTGEADEDDAEIDDLSKALETGSTAAPATPAPRPTDAPTDGGAQDGDAEHEPPPTPAETPDVTAEAAEADGPAYPVSQLLLLYDHESTTLPDIDRLRAQLDVALTPTPTGYVAPRTKAPVERVALDEIGDDGVDRLHGSALQAIARRVVEAINQRGVVGVYVQPSDLQIGPQGQDLRTGTRALAMMVRVARIAEVRTIAQGDRFEYSEGINQPGHESIRADSPVGIGGVVRKDELDRYTYLLNRHPGRRASMALGPSRTEGGAVLDYLIHETKPWTLYGQVANDGTETTGEWRYRVGLVHNQLTGNDDILSLDYVTTGLGGDETAAFVGSYEAPLFDSRRLRWRVYGLTSEFTADDVAQGTLEFTGDQWWAGGDLIWNVFQYRQLFLDVVAGAKYQHIEVNNAFAAIEGDEDFFLPHVGLTLERLTPATSTTASVDLAYNLADVAGTDEATIDNLGRLFVEEEFAVLNWSVRQSLYLEPLLWYDRWADPSTPGSTLAHELLLRASGQYTFGDRVAPQFQSTVGGAHTVRGYEQSTTAGDTTYVVSAEYRFHLPRALAIDPDPYDTYLFGDPFRLTPQAPYGSADWDLVLKGFVDAGWTEVEDAIGAESDEQLLSVGVGTELSFKRHLTLQVDWGYVLQEARDVEDGDSELHFRANFLY